MNLKKLKLYFQVFKKGATCLRLKGACKEIGLSISAVCALIFTCILLIFISYLLARYTPFYATMYKTDETLLICNDNIENCVLMGLPYTALFVPLIIIYTILYFDKNTVKTVIIFTIITTSIIAFIYHMKFFAFQLESNGYIAHSHGIEHQYNYTNTKPCYFNETINNYNRDCVNILEDLFKWVILSILILAFLAFFTFIMYETCCKDYAKSIREDMENIDLESAKIDN